LVLKGESSRKIRPYTDSTASPAHDDEMFAMGVRRERRRFPVGASPTRQPLQPEATGAVIEETKWLNATQRRMQIPGIPDHGEIAPDAVAADRVVAFRERADDRGLVRKVLIERAERHAAAFDDIAHAEGFAAFFSHQLGRAAENFLEPLAAALLRGYEARQRGRAI
jgi:hypothetical protein